METHKYESLGTHTPAPTYHVSIPPAAHVRLAHNLEQGNTCGQAQHRQGHGMG